LEPTCPFSVKAFGKLDDLLAQAGEHHRVPVKCAMLRRYWPRRAAFKNPVRAAIRRAWRLDADRGAGSERAAGTALLMPQAEDKV
jgi:hypothetical protein